MSTRPARIVVLVLAAAVSCRPDDQRTYTLDAAAAYILLTLRPEVLEED